MPTISPPARSDTAPSTRPEQRTALLVGLVALVALPAIVALVATWTQRWFPVVDSAFLELRLHDLLRHPTEVGPYSRVGASHPGPLMFYLLAPGYWLTGAGSLAMLRAAALLNLASIVGILWVAHRRGGLPLLLGTGVGLGALLWTFAGLLADAWNPWLAILPFVLFVLASWSVAVGDHRMLVLAAFVGSFLVQTHVGYAVPVLAAGAWCVVWLARSHRLERRGLGPAARTERDRVLMVSVGLALLVSVVLWLPPVHQQVTGHPGNLSQLLDEVRNPDQPPVGWATAAGVLARELGGVRPPWIGGTEVAGGSVTTAPLRLLLVPGLPFVAALVAALVRRRREAALLQGTVAVTVLSGLFAVSRIDGVVSDYLVRWAWPLGMLVWLSTGWSLWRALSDDWRRRIGPACGAVAGAGIVVLSLLGAVDAARDDPPNTRWSQMIDTLDDPVFESAGDEGPVSFVPGSSDTDTLAAITGLELQAALRGIEFVAPDGNADQVGRHRTVDAASAGTSFVVASGPDAIAELAARADLEQVAYYDGSGQNDDGSPGVPVAVFRGT